MATISRYETANGKRYRVRYRKPDHSQTDKRGFKTKREAELFAASVEVKKATGAYVDPRLGSSKVTDLARSWFAGQVHLKPSSRRVMETTWRVHCEPLWGPQSVSNVARADIQDWIASLTNGSPEDEVKALSPSTVRRAHGLLLAVLEDAVRDRRIPTNPARGLSLPQPKPRAARYLTHEQVHALADASGDFGTLIRVLAYTGLRWGEATELRPADVKLDRRRIEVARNAVRVGQEFVVGTPKGHKVRSVPIAPFLVNELRELIERKADGTLLFSDAAGEHLTTPTTYRYTWFRRALKAAELPADLTIHDLRHTAASLAISAGANVKAVQRMLGHKSAAMTLDIYGDLFDDDLDAVGVALDAARSRSSVGKMWANPISGAEGEAA